MKKTLLTLGGLLIALAAVAQTVSVTLLPENIPFTLQWDHEREEPGVYYKLYAGTNLYQLFTTNDFTITGVTNGISTARAQVNGLPKGTNALSVVAVSPTYGTNAGGVSDPSSNLNVKVLGKPLAPQGLQKP